MALGARAEGLTVKALFLALEITIFETYGHNLGKMNISRLQGRGRSSRSESAKVRIRWCQVVHETSRYKKTKPLDGLNNPRL